jgi:5'-methylthioadenosine phosphorylase
MTKAVLGIIGGSGLYDLPGLKNVREQLIHSPWGAPSAPLRIGEIDGLPIVFLSRHDKGHRLSPTDINYRANIDVLKRAGVTDLVSLSACGSFKEELPPGTFVLVDQFVDRTYHRPNSFFGTGCVAHVSMAHPVSPHLRIHLAQAAEAEGISFAREGTYVCIEGPQFSTLAESLTYKQLGYSVIGMTNLPDLLRDGRHGHRFRLLAPRPRRGSGERHHQGAARQCREGSAARSATGAKLPARARALSDRFGPRARHRDHHRARGARS